MPKITRSVAKIGYNNNKQVQNSYLL